MMTRGDSDSSVAKRKCSPCQQEDDDDDATSDAHNGINSWDSLSEDVVHHIHTLMPMRDAARAASVSRSFLRSWRHHPNLTFSMEELGLIGQEGTEDERALDLLSIIDRILQNHSGIGVKTLKLEFPWNRKKLDTCYVDRFLKTAIAPGIQELTVTMPSLRYNFPCSLLSRESGESIRYLKLTNSGFHPTAGLGCLTRLHLQSVCIGDDELECFLSNSLVLMHLKLIYCGEIICLKIPRMLRYLRSLEVLRCKMLQAIESNAPNISTIHLTVDDTVDVSLGDGSLQVKELRLSPAFASYSLGKLPLIAPSLETLNISLPHKVSTLVVPGQFHHLKFLNIYLPVASEGYDYLSLLDFLEASPALETFILWTRIVQPAGRIHGDLSHLTHTRESCHGSLRNVTIHSFRSAQSMMELTCLMLKHIASLECLALDTTHGYSRCSSSRSGRCFPMGTVAVREAQDALVAIRKYIKPQVPSHVDLTVVEPCSSCHMQCHN